MITPEMLANLPSNKKWWWIIGVQDGVQALIGPFISEAQATEVGMQKISGADFEILPLPTRNDARATRIVKALRLKQEEGASIPDLLKKVKHPK